KKCQIFAAPFAVNLELGKGKDTTVQPDLVVVCDPSKLDKRGCNGAPDVVIEILSPSTAGLDMGIKQRKYQDAGVLEYWIADPANRIIQMFTLKDGLYFANNFVEDETVVSGVLKGLEIPLPEIFPPEEAEQNNDNQQEED
ncbi:MAG: Uma2 family endonuclease, partial [Clostridiales bacterium]|nr:Uma2 family endonuclease [Clostridiales bacterium]